MTIPISPKTTHLSSCHLSALQSPCPDDGFDSIRLKGIRFSYHVDEVFDIDLPALQHGTDGLIYTCVTTPYIPATDENMSVLLLYQSFQIDLPEGPQNEVEAAV